MDVQGDKQVFIPRIICKYKTSCEYCMLVCWSVKLMSMGPWVHGSMGQWVHGLLRLAILISN